MASVDDQIAEKVAYEMRTHELKQAHGLLAKARTLLRSAEMHLEAQDQPFADDVEHVVAVCLETLMWRIETAVRDRP